MALSQGMLRRRSAHRPTFTSEGPARPHSTETWSEEQARTRAVPVPLLARWRGHGKSLGHAPPVGGPAFIPLPEGRGLSPGLKLKETGSHAPCVEPRHVTTHRLRIAPD